MIMPDNPIVLKRAALIVSYRCNMRCKLCITYSPYYKIPGHYSLSDLCKATDKLFQIVGYIGKFTVSGGEPLLHKELPQILTHILKYRAKIDFVELISNGSIVPNDALMLVLSEHNKDIRLLIDNYGPALSNKLDEVNEKLKAAGINYKIRPYFGNDPHCGGWVDCTDFSRKRFQEYEAAEIFSRCVYPQKMGFSYAITNGVMYPCPFSRRCMELSIIPRRPEEFIDLFDETQTIEYHRRKLNGMQNAKMITACYYCAGVCEDSQHYPPAEQLKDGEKQEIRS
jgi:ferredoxin